MELLPKTRGRVAWSDETVDRARPAASLDRQTAVAVAAIERALRQFAHDSLGSALPASPDDPVDPFSADLAMNDGPPVAGFDVLARAGSSDRGIVTRASRRRAASNHDGLQHAARGAADAQALRQAWSSWYARHQDHEGHERVASALRVSEVELLRALEGQGVHAVDVDLAALLEPLGSWGRVVVELRHPLGVASVGLAPTQVRVESGQLLLVDPHRQFALGARAFHECFLVQGAGGLALHGFDQAGEVVARLRLIDLGRSHPSTQPALRHMTSRTVGADVSQPDRATPAGDRLTQLGWCLVEHQVVEPEALGRLCAHLGRLLARPSVLNFMMESEAAILSCQNTRLRQIGTRSRMLPQMSDCRLSLRPGSVRRASLCMASDGRAFLRLSSAHGHGLRFQPPGTPEQARAWVEALLSPRS